MYKIIFIFLISFQSIISNDNIVKSSELDIFLFKIGFQTLLNDIKLTKEKVNFNESELNELNKKLDFIITKINFNKKIKRDISSSNLFELMSSKDKLNDYFFGRVLVDELNIKSEPYYDSNILYVLKRNDIVNIEYCDTFNWCKLKNESSFIPKHLLKIYN